MTMTWKRRMVSGLLTTVFAASLLPVSVFAADCAHETLVKGKCRNESCGQQFVAMVGTTPYDTVDKAVTAASLLEDKAVVLLADVSGVKLDLGETYLTVLPDGKADGTVSEVITLKDCEITGKHAERLLLNKGSLVLSNVTMTNTNKDGGMAVYTMGPDEAAKEALQEGEKLDPVELSVISGSYTGKYALGVKQSTVKLNQLRTAEQPELAGVPALEGSAADFRMEEGGMIEVMTDLGADTTYTVKAEEPGPVAHVAIDGAAVTPAAKWFANADAKGVSAFEDGVWTMSAVIAEDAVAISAGEFTYNGKQQLPEVTVTMGEKTLEKDTDYTVTCEPAEAVKAGEYTLTISGVSDYSGTVIRKFVIKTVAATPTLTVETPAEGFRYTGSPLTPNVVVKVGETVIGSEHYDVAYTNNTAVGTATVTVTAKEGGSYTFEKLTQTFEIGKAAQTALEITGKADNLTYGTAPIQLGVAGGSGDGAVTWEITKGAEHVTIDANGLLTVKSVGAVTVKASKAATEGYDASTAEWSFEVMPAVLTVGKVTAAEKTYDGKTTVNILSVEIHGAVLGDDVKVQLEGLTGELEKANVGAYDKVKLGNMSLAGAAASNYKLTVPAESVSCKVTVKKANLPAGLEKIEVSLPVTSTMVEVSNLGAGMPKDAGALTYHNRLQETVSGNKVIVLKWGVDANGKLTSEIVNGAGGDTITYTVAVESENYNNAEVKVVVSLGAEAVDASKITVTPKSESLTYNGADQKPGVTVKNGDTTLKEGTDYTVTYPTDSKSVGEKEIKITFKGNFTGTATGKYTINKAKVKVSGGSVSDKTFDGGISANVNVGTLSGVVKGDDVKLTGKGVFADKNSGSNKKVSVTFSLSGKDAGNYELTNADATFTGRIYAISANSLYNALGSLSTANANSTKKQTLQNVVSQANLALSDGGLSSSERTSITAAKDDAETMLSRIEAAAAAANTESIRATEKVTRDNVKLSDQAALTKAQSDLNTALTTYSGNYTDGERKEIETDKTRVADALALVTKVDSAQKLITALPTDYENLTTETANAVNAADQAYQGLNDYGRSLIDEATTKKLTYAVAAIGGVVPTDGPQITPNISGVGNAGDVEDKDTIDFPMWIIWLALLLASACGAGYLLWYKKQQEYYDEEDDEAFFF